MRGISSTRVSSIQQPTPSLDRINQLKQLSHPTFWRLPGVKKINNSGDSDKTIPLAATFDGDVFSAGCLFFYFLTRGIHPFGDERSILQNISQRNPINFNELENMKFDFARKSIREMIGQLPLIKPERQLLCAAARRFKKALRALPMQFYYENRIRGEIIKHKFLLNGTFEGNQVAVMELPDVRITSEDFEKDVREVEALKGLDHENVLKLLHVDDDENEELKYRYFLFEKCAGSIKDYCENKYKGPELPPDAIVLYEIAAGLNYIHSRNLVHRNIDPGNILVSITGHMKLSGVGLAGGPMMNYRVPEIIQILLKEGNFPPDLKRENDLFQHATAQSDVFSTGCVFFCFLTRGKHPFGESFVFHNYVWDKPVLLNEGERLPRNHFAFDLIGKMIAKVDERIDLSKVIEELIPCLPQCRQFKEVFKSLKIPNESVYHSFAPWRKRRQNRIRMMRKI